MPGWARNQELNEAGFHGSQNGACDWLWFLKTNFRFDSSQKSPTRESVKDDFSTSVDQDDKWFWRQQAQLHAESLLNPGGNLHSLLKASLLHVYFCDVSPYWGYAERLYSAAGTLDWSQWGSSDMFQCSRLESTGALDDGGCGRSLSAKGSIWSGTESYASQRQATLDKSMAEPPA